jgi:L-iditol 2-dehydrogenase
MKAWVLHGLNDLKLEEIPKPIPKDGELLVKVKAAGICSSDIQRIFVSGAYHYPIVLGHEFSGITEDGRRVGVFPLLPCFNCESCKAGNYEICTNYSYIGSRQNGAFAEYVAVPEWNLIDLPDSVTFEQAALLEPAAVALHAVSKIDFANVKSVAVVGNGTIGQLITKWLEIKGIENISIFGRNDKPKSADVYIEAVGSVYAFATCVKKTAANGQIILVGNPNIDFKIEQKLYWQILRKQLTLKGSWNSNWRGDWEAVIENLSVLHLNDIITDRFALYELNKALEIMREKRRNNGRIILS